MGEKLYGLQTLRAIAAAFVVFVHAQSTYLDKVGPAVNPLPGFPSGESGVQLFFCISGFIIFTVGMPLPPGIESVQGFIWRRIARIVPLYWCATLIYAAKLALVGTPPSVGNIVKSLFFIPYGEVLMRPVLGAGWTLNYEMFFYLAFAATLLLGRRLRLLAMLVFFAGMRLAGAFGLFDDGPVGWPLAQLSQPYLDFFLLGMLLGAGRLALRQRRGAFRLSPVAAATLSLALFTVGCAFWPLLVGGATPWFPALLIVGATMGISLLEAPVQGRPGRFFMLGRAAGDASFSTYLTHGFVMGPAARVLHITELPVPGWLFSCAMVVACSVAGYGVYRLFEAPLMARLQPRRSVASGRVPAT